MLGGDQIKSTANIPAGTLLDKPAIPGLIAIHHPKSAGSRYPGATEGLREGGSQPCSKAWNCEGSEGMICLGRRALPRANTMSWDSGPPGSGWGWVQGWVQGGGCSFLHLLPVAVEPQGWIGSALPLGVGQHNWAWTPRTGSSRNDPALLLGFLAGGACWPQSTTSPKVTETQLAGNWGTICQPRRLSLGGTPLGASGQSWCGHCPPGRRCLPHAPAGRLWSMPPYKP